MPEKKHKFESPLSSLPPLTLVLGNVPEPDPGQVSQPFRPFTQDKPEEARQQVNKLIGHLKEKKTC